ncbi:hypothetical protein GY45DRAFT_1376288 [Cubamyces sp. BRFM 1775]|nr:hypothetical protein GY45DRAFT_1376288 [Cubamyces sp. BRFM 1775]
MSIKILETPEKGHTLQDDMESLLYVILYCSLRHLPHSMRNPEHLYRFIHKFFDDCSYGVGKLHGGDAKLVNSDDRTWTQRITFNSKNIADWLNTAMNYHHPPRHLRWEWWDRWSNPDYLDTFWGAFLERRDLEKDDAVDNKVQKPIEYVRPIEDSRVPFIPPARSGMYPSSDHHRASQEERATTPPARVFEA